MVRIGQKIGKRIRQIIIDTQASRWLLISSLILTSMMMTPSLATLIAQMMNLLFLLLLRKSAKIEVIAKHRLG